MLFFYLNSSKCLWCFVAKVKQSKPEIVRWESFTCMCTMWRTPDLTKRYMRTWAWECVVPTYGVLGSALYNVMNHPNLSRMELALKCVSLLQMSFCVYHPTDTYSGGNPAFLRWSLSILLKALVFGFLFFEWLVCSFSESIFLQHMSPCSLFLCLILSVCEDLQGSVCMASVHMYCVCTNVHGASL